MGMGYVTDVPYNIGDAPAKAFVEITSKFPQAYMSATGVLWLPQEYADWRFHSFLFGPDGKPYLEVGNGATSDKPTIGNGEKKMLGDVLMNLGVAQPALDEVIMKGLMGLNRIRPSRKTQY